MIRKELNILLINPPLAGVYGDFKGPTQLNMGLAYLAAMIQDKRVNLLDIGAQGISLESFRDILNRDKYDLAGLNVTTPTFSSSLRLAEEIKKISPGTRVVFGGIHPTVDPAGVLAYDCVDIAAIGEGELTFKELVEVLEKDGDISAVAGIAYKENGAYKFNTPRPLIEDIDTIPFPPRHLFDNKGYTYPDSLYRNTAPVITSRGCPGMCTYCSSHNIFTRKFRARSAANIVDEFEYLVKVCGAQEIHIWDDNFPTIKKRVFEVRDEVLRRGLGVKFSFPNGVRVDFLDRQVLKAMKEMGTYSLAIGAESGSQEILNNARKGIKLEKVEEAIRIAKEEKLETWVFFIIGLPGETPETIRRTIDFAKKTDPDIVKFHILKPFPKSEVYEYLHSRNFILSYDYDHYGIHTPPVHRLEGLTPEDMLKWQKKAYFDFYFRLSKIPQQIFRIKTFNRLILNIQSAVSILKMVFKNSRPVYDDSRFSSGPQKTEVLPKVSVVIAVGRDNPTFEESLSKQDYPDFEILAVSGMAAAQARNTGVKKAGGQIIIFIDDDVILPQGWMKKGVAALLNSGADMVGGPNIVLPQASLGERISDFLLRAKILNAFRKKFNKDGYEGFSSYKDFATCNMLLYKRVFDKVGLFNENYKYGEDMEFLLRCAVGGIRMYYSSEFFIYHKRRNFPFAHIKQVFRWGYWNARLALKYPFMFRRLDIAGSLVFLPALLVLVYFYPVPVSIALLAFLPLAIHFLSYSVGVIVSLAGVLFNPVALIRAVLRRI